jgi:hypothetical protein
LGRFTACATFLASSNVLGILTLALSSTSRHTYQNAPITYHGIDQVLPSTIVTGATFAGALPTWPSIDLPNAVRSRSWPMPAKRAGAPVSSCPTSGVFLFSMAATYLVCTSSNVKYSTVTLPPCFCAQRAALASMALFVGSTYVFRIQSRKLAAFFCAGACCTPSATAADAPAAPTRNFRRLTCCGISPSFEVRPSPS